MKAPDHFKTLFSPQDIQVMVEGLAEQVDKTLPAEEPVVCVGVLKGAWIFHADFCRALKRPVTVDFIRASSYGAGTSSSGVVRILKDIEVDVRNKHVLVVEEIVDSGRTLSFIKQRLEQAGAASVKVVALLDKKQRRAVPFQADFVGAEVGNHFVVGYGLDWGENYRTLPGIYIVPGEALH